MSENWHSEYDFRSGKIFVQDVSQEEPELVAENIRSKEDARLIAAAPELLEACRTITDAIDPESAYADHSDAVSASREAQRAIEKATTPPQK